MSTHRFLSQAQIVAKMIPAVLQQRGLEPALRKFVLTETPAGEAWLFAVLDETRLARMEAYTSTDLVHQLSTTLRGKPVILSNNTGLRYAVLLSPPKRLPRRAPFPGLEPDKVLLGIKPGGLLVATTWYELGHMLVAGISGAGKSNFLRLLTYQAIAGDARLLLSDLDGTTFPMLAEHPALIAPIAANAESALEIVRHALAECDRRAGLYQRAPGYPEKLEEYNLVAARNTWDALPRVLVVLDEFNNTVSAAGGAESELARLAMSLAMRGRKFGVTLIFAAQEFSKGVIGKIQSHAQSAVCFRVQSQETARAIGRANAVRLPTDRPGLAFTPWGLVQTYFLPKSFLLESIPNATMDEKSRVLAERAVQAGKLTQEMLESSGCGSKEARRLLDTWKGRGWLRLDPAQRNAHAPTEKLVDLLQKPAN